MCGQGQEVVTCDPTPKVGIGSQASKRLHLPRKKEVGSQAIMGPGHAGTSRRHRKYCTWTTKNFSEDTKILHLPHKEVGSQRTSRRHRKYCTCHTKSVSVTCDSSQQASIRSGDNISEASKLLHLPRKTHGKGHKLSLGSQAIRT